MNHWRGTVHITRRRAELSLGCLDGGVLMVVELSALEMLTKMPIFRCVQCAIIIEVTVSFRS